MEQQELIQEGNMLRAKFKITTNHQDVVNEISPEYLISGLSLFRVKVLAICYNKNNYGNYYDQHMTVHVKFAKAHDKIKNISYQIKFNCVKFGVTDKLFICADTWHLVYERQQAKVKEVFVFEFELTCHMDVPKSAWSFETLHDDAELSDFELRGEDGSVSVHKAVLAGYSPVFKTMLSGKWRETNEGRVDVPGMSKEILQGFKDYMYLQKLPKTGLEEILQLASYYMMTDLENKCSVLILSKLNAKNAVDMAEFAGKYRIELLILGILKFVEKGLIKVDDIELNSKYESKHLPKAAEVMEVTSNPDK